MIEVLATLIRKIREWWYWHIGPCPDCGRLHLFGGHDGCIPF